MIHHAREPQKSKSESRSVVSHSLRPHELYSPWNSPGQNTGVGSRSLLQGIFPTQGSNPGLLHCRWILYQLSHKGSPTRVKLTGNFVSETREAGSELAYSSTERKKYCQSRGLCPIKHLSKMKMK